LKMWRLRVQNTTEVHLQIHMAEFTERATSNTNRKLVRKCKINEYLISIKENFLKFISKLEIKSSLSLL